MLKRLEISALVACILISGLIGCVGTIIETATDTAITIAKVPVKVGGAVVDVVTGEGEDDE